MHCFTIHKVFNKNIQMVISSTCHFVIFSFFSFFFFKFTKFKKEGKKNELHRDEYLGLVTRVRRKSGERVSKTPWENEWIIRRQIVWFSERATTRNNDGRRRAGNWRFPLKWSLDTSPRKVRLRGVIIKQARTLKAVRPAINSHRAIGQSLLLSMRRAIDHGR